MNLYKFLIICVISILISSCNSLKEELYLVRIGDKSGYINAKGVFEINPKYDDAHIFTEELALVKDKNGLYGYINHKGEYEIAPIYLRGTKFSEGLACVVKPGGKIQYINKNNKVIIETDASFAFEFRNGMASIIINQAKGYIDLNGKIKVEPEFHFASDYNEGFALVGKYKENKNQSQDDIEWGFINKKGEFPFGMQFKSGVSETFFNDNIGSVILHPVNPSNFNDGLAYVSYDGEKWGFIDKSGLFKIPPMADYKEINGLKSSDKLVKVSLNGKNGFINQKGQAVIPPQYDEAKNFMNGLAPVKLNDKWGYINKGQNLVIDNIYDDAFEFNGDVAYVLMDKNYSLINKKGQLLTNIKIDGITLENYNNGISSDYINSDEVYNYFINKSKPLNANSTLKDFITNSSINIKRFDDKCFEAESNLNELKEQHSSCKCNFG